ncbi:MAG: hypothetical protein P0Y65_05345 [Candidatus Devosia phytovorans]|uniref:Uncharacterized protein n=1 Tax=Candidatus Devosia phytovorans TaxID=3121372 RepID=A0AAJ5VWV9_9HYPH|nr:hypothetical protein [Devosia sp.]WEK05680.1 MAG: hypothetical protein P0Y65_05345 [Devosia sp.]
MTDRDGLWITERDHFVRAGTNSLVRTDVAAGTTVAGVPARPIEMRHA